MIFSFVQYSYLHLYHYILMYSIFDYPLLMIILNSIFFKLKHLFNFESDSLLDSHMTKPETEVVQKWQLIHTANVCTKF